MIKLNRIHKISILLVIIILTWLILKPNKVSISHELLLDKELQLREMKYDILKRYELYPESTYEWTKDVIDSVKIREYENKYSIQILIERGGIYNFSDGEEYIYTVFSRLKIFSISFQVVSDEQEFIQFSNELVNSTRKKYGKYSEIIVKDTRKIYIWDIGNHYFIIYLDNFPENYYMLHKRSINLTWTKDIDRYKN